jgi:hypothetical protein
MADRTNFRGFEAVRLENGKGDELTILTEVGPRIISFRPEGGDNFFYVNDENFKGDAHPDKWHVYGGTRLWVSPEAPITYAPDNRAVKTEVEDSRVTLTAPDPRTGIKRIIEVKARERTFSLTFTILNEGTMLHTAGLWVLSCLEPAAGTSIYLPWGEEGHWNVKDMKYWRSWLEAGSDIESKQWSPTNEFFIIRPTGETGKVGFRNRYGFALFQRDTLSFIKRSPYYESAQYPDDGCTFEVYTSREFYEIETLSPLFCLKPGIPYSHREEWWAGHETIDTGSIASVHSFANDTFD